MNTVRRDAMTSVLCTEVPCTADGCDTFGGQAECQRVADEIERGVDWAEVDR